MGEGEVTPLAAPTPLNRQSQDIAYVITSTISPHRAHLVITAPGVSSSHIAKVATYFYVAYYVWPYHETVRMSVCLSVRLSVCLSRVISRKRSQIEP